MFKYINIKMNKIYPALVVSTMSSGKSTLINALIDKNVLPSSNQACTAKAVAILDNDKKTDFSAYIVTSEGKYLHLNDVDIDVVKKFNSTNDVKEMVLEGQIKGVKNSKKSLLLIDTPGVNNVMDKSHREATFKVLEENSEGLIIYVINAEQIGTYDDKELLMSIASKFNNNSNFNVIFVLNKADSIDPQKEPLEKVVELCEKYLIDNGFENPSIIPVSAAAALLFKSVLRGDKLSTREKRNFFGYYDAFESKAFSLVDYVSTKERHNLNEIIDVDGEEYTKAQIYAALYNTGLTYLETVIDEALSNSLNPKAPKVTFNKKEETNSQQKKQFITNGIYFGFKKHKEG